jgi:hypothetical protein
LGTFTNEASTIVPSLATIPFEISLEVNSSNNFLDKPFSFSCSLNNHIVFSSGRYVYLQNNTETAVQSSGIYQ